MTRVIILFFLLTCMACANKSNLNFDKAQLLEISSSADFISYKHLIESDNRFSSSFMFDTLDVDIFKQQNAEIIFNIMQRDLEWFYKEGTIIRFDHTEKTKLIDQKDDLDNLFIWQDNLLSTLDSIQSHKGQSKMINDLPFQHVRYMHESKSHIDSNQIVVNEFQYYIPKKSMKGLRQKTIVVREGDTLQIQNHRFLQIEFSPEERLTALIKRFRENKYEIETIDESLPFGSPPIKEGDKLTKSIYSDIDGMEVDLVTEGYSLLIFSYIGCTPCEIAMSDLEKDYKALKDNVNMFYSNFQNNKVANNKYVKNKAFIKSSFGRESNMISDFRLPVSPTFVVINSRGKVERIIEGYDDTVFSEIEEIINL